MIKRNILGVVGALALTACGSRPNVDEAKQAIVNVRALDLGGRALRCLPKYDINVVTGSTELKGDLRRRFLTREADGAGIRVFIESSSVTTYGSQTVYYVNAADECIVFAESISLQEYSQRLGLNPVGVSPFYSIEVKKEEPTKPAGPVPAVPESN